VCNILHQIVQDTVWASNNIFILHCAELTAMAKEKHQYKMLRR
jgi:hypothetical protein